MSLLNQYLSNKLAMQKASSVQLDVIPYLIKSSGVGLKMKTGLRPSIKSVKPTIKPVNPSAKVSNSSLKVSKPEGRVVNPNYTIPLELFRKSYLQSRKPQPYMKFMDNYPSGYGPLLGSVLTGAGLTGFIAGALSAMIDTPALKERTNNIMNSWKDRGYDEGYLEGMIYGATGK